MNIQTMAELPPKTKVPAIAAIITKVYERRSGGSGDKAWTVQNVMIKDDSGEIKVNIWGHPEILGPSAGQWLFITPGMSEKYGSFGVQTELNEWQDTEGNARAEQQIKVSAKASVKVGQSSQGQPAAEPQLGLPPPVLVPVRTQAQVTMTAAPVILPAGASPTITPTVQLQRNCVATSAKAAQIGNAYMIAIDRMLKVQTWALHRYGFQVPEVALCAWITSTVLDLNKGAYTSSLPDRASVTEYLQSLKVPVPLPPPPPPPAPIEPEPVSQSPGEHDDVPF